MTDLNVWTMVWTASCYEGIEQRHEVSTMFNSRLEQAMHNHHAVLVELCGMIAEWTALEVPQSIQKDIMTGLGFGAQEIHDAFRVFSDEAEAEFGVAKEAPAYDVVNSVS